MNNKLQSFQPSFQITGEEEEETSGGQRIELQCCPVAQGPCSLVEMCRRDDRDWTDDRQVPEHRDTGCSLPWQKPQQHRGVSNAHLSLQSRRPLAGGPGRTPGELLPPSIHRTQLRAGKGMAALRQYVLLDVLSNSTSQVLDWQRPKL